jgi:hypothetical protein
LTDRHRVRFLQNAPFSAVVCGVQGSGKSHSVAVLLESMLIPEYRPIGSLDKPLSGLVLHFGEGGPGSRPSEASWVGVPCVENAKTPNVQVYVSRSSLNTMRKVYAPLGSKVTVDALQFEESELDAAGFLSMMAVGSSESAPLYVQAILVSAFIQLQFGRVVYLFLVNSTGPRRELHVPKIHGCT